MATLRITGILTIVLFIGQLCAAQTKIISIPTYPNGDSTYWFTWQQKQVRKAKLPNLIYSSDSLHFRFSTENQSVDIWTLDFKRFFGTLSNYTTRYKPNNYKRKNPKPPKFYSQKADLDTGTARQIYTLFASLSIFSIPDDSRIEGWQPGKDGDEFLLEYSTPNRYAFKSYWTPSYYKAQIKEAAVIDSLCQQLERTLQLQKSFGAFIHTLPRGSYHAGGMTIIMAAKDRKKK